MQGQYIRRCDMGMCAIQKAFHREKEQKSLYLESGVLDVGYVSFHESEIVNRDKEVSLFEHTNIVMCLSTKDYMRVDT